MSTSVIEAGNYRYVISTFTATDEAPSAASTAVRFTLTKPDGTSTVATDGSVDVSGPVAGSTGGLTSTTWTWKTPVFEQPGKYELAVESTAGIIAAHRTPVIVPNY